ncbi:hypothetical protein CYMTET_32425 [Cymbomonas tetramitiformis]|nr:hypothetical protein CYMTET_32425 [Cymbomonas tetramitiformis]
MTDAGALAKVEEARSGLSAPNRKIVMSLGLFPGDFDKLQSAEKFLQLPPTTDPAKVYETLCQFPYAVRIGLASAWANKHKAELSLHAVISWLTQDVENEPLEIDLPDDLTLLFPPQQTSVPRSYDKHQLGLHMAAATRPRTPLGCGGTHEALKASLASPSLFLKKLAAKEVLRSEPDEGVLLATFQQATKSVQRKIISNAIRFRRVHFLRELMPLLVAKSHDVAAPVLHACDADTVGVHLDVLKTCKQLEWRQMWKFHPKIVLNLLRSELETGSVDGEIAAVKTWATWKPRLVHSGRVYQGLCAQQLLLLMDAQPLKLAPSAICTALRACSCKALPPAMVIPMLESHVQTLDNGLKVLSVAAVLGEKRSIPEVVSLQMTLLQPPNAERFRHSVLNTGLLIPFISQFLDACTPGLLDEFKETETFRFVSDLLMEMVKHGSIAQKLEALKVTNAFMMRHAPTPEALGLKLDSKMLCQLIKSRQISEAINTWCTQCLPYPLAAVKSVVESIMQALAQKVTKACTPVAQKLLLLRDGLTQLATECTSLVKSMTELARRYSAVWPELETLPMSIANTELSQPTLSLCRTMLGDLPNSHSAMQVLDDESARGSLRVLRALWRSAAEETEEYLRELMQKVVKAYEEASPYKKGTHAARGSMWSNARTHLGRGLYIMKNSMLTSLPLQNPPPGSAQPPPSPLLTREVRGSQRLLLKPERYMELVQLLVGAMEKASAHVREGLAAPEMAQADKARYEDELKALPACLLVDYAKFVKAAWGDPRYAAQVPEMLKTYALLLAGAGKALPAATEGDAMAEEPFRSVVQKSAGADLCLDTQMLQYITAEETLKAERAALLQHLLELRATQNHHQADAIITASTMPRPMRKWLVGEYLGDGVGGWVSIPTKWQLRMLKHADVADPAVRKLMVETLGNRTKREERTEGLLTMLASTCKSESPDMVLTALRILRNKLKNETKTSRMSILECLKDELADYDQCNTGRLLKILDTAVIPEGGDSGMGEGAPGETLGKKVMEVLKLMLQDAMQSGNK